MEEVIKSYQSNENLKYEINNGNIRCYYCEEAFLEIGQRKWLYPVNLNRIISLENFKKSIAAYKILNFMISCV